MAGTGGGAENDRERRLQDLLLQIRSYQDSLRELSRQSALAERAIAEAAATASALEELPKSKSDEAYVPIGSGVFIKARLLDKGNVLVSTGAGVRISKTLEEARRFLDSRMKRLKGENEKIKSRADRISAELEAAGRAADELYAGSRG